MPLSLAFVAKGPLKGSPRAYEPLSSHRISVASTGVGEGHSPFFRSPEVTYTPLGSARSKVDGATQGLHLPSSSPRMPPGQASSEHTPRRAYRVAGSEPVHVKEHGYGLPPFKEQLVDILHEETTRMYPSTATWIGSRCTFSTFNPDMLYIECAARSP